MIKGYYALIAAFLSQYVQTDEGGAIPPDPRMICAAIRVLIEDGVMTRDEIRLAAIRGYNVIIREDLFPEE